ncbi:zinc transporter [uncultured Parasphingorhabdus sp.]|uniref:ZIP family metal transporter n=1 Tax=uncultured Parasphingorhabdus sp. TaxID=2709694 RepID=UPI0030DD8173|tara:strand:+ start:41536 stop:42240 length:705 start_codon:yes stop_codon:yes gene_type:complete
MLMTFLVVVVVSAALIAGALWGVYGKISSKTEGFVIALAGGALVVSLVSEMIQPAVEQSNLWVGLGSVAAGAAVFSGVDYWIDEKWGAEGGGGLLAAITLDGVPENLALGVALIGAAPVEVAALAGSILLSNLPEAAGGAKQMVGNGLSRGKTLGLWALTALILSAAAIIGYFALEGVSPHVLAATRCFAAGAVVASLATEVFPKAYKEDHHMAGVATAIGVILAVFLGELATA